MTRRSVGRASSRLARRVEAAAGGDEGEGEVMLPALKSEGATADERLAQYDEVRWCKLDHGLKAPCFQPLNLRVRALLSI